MIQNDFEEPTNPREGASVGYGCIAVLVVLIVIGCLLLFSSCNGGFERKDPRAVIYREKISETDTSEVWRNVTYEIVSVSYDTVPKVQTVPKDRVDLNDYLGSPGDETDWNYTEIDDDQQKYLDSIGVYWDSNKEYWRKR